MSKDQNGNGDGNAADAKSIMVGDKEYSAEQVAELVSGAAKSTQIMQDYAPIRQLAEKYNMNLEDLPGQFEGSAAAISRLMDEGVIDQQGQLVKPAAGSQAGGDEDFLANLLKGDQGGDGDLSGKGPDAAALKALSTIRGETQALVDEVKELKDSNAMLLRHTLAEKVRKEYPDLNDDDISRAMGAAKADPRKSLLEHAGVIAGQHTTHAEEMRQKHAKEFGINLEEFDKRNEQTDVDSKSGMAVLGKRKLSFNPKKGDTNTVSPLEATAAYLEKADM